MSEIRCPIVWHTQAAFLGFVQHGDIKLGITIVGKPGEWQLMALETSATAVGEVLDSHAHEFLGDFKDFEKARRRGTIYARDWLRSKIPKKKCACGPIKRKRR